MCQSQLPIRDRVITYPQPLRRPAFLPAPKSRMGEKAAMPGQPVRSRVSGLSPSDSLSQITGCCQPLPQSFSKLRNSHVSLNPLSSRLLRLAT